MLVESWVVEGGSLFGAVRDSNARSATSRDDRNDMDVMSPSAESMGSSVVHDKLACITNGVYVHSVIRCLYPYQVQVTWWSDTAMQTKVLLQLLSLAMCPDGLVELS